ncbi:MAG: sporulation protein YabP [Bacilli bacterium]|nr:sporulation protein YabP [Bacilli bacterium]
MDKDILSGNHSVSIGQRKSINITGVKKIENFDENEFLLETNMGFMLIKGSSLEIIKLDTYQGDVSIKGKIDSLTYLETSKKQDKQESVFSKLFK